jgi:DNA modification methylase
MSEIRMPTADDPAVLVCGDALDVLHRLPDGCVDAVVTDPPFGIDFGGYLSHDDDPAAYAGWMKSVVLEINRLVAGGPVFMWQGMPNCGRWHEWLPEGFRLFAACKGFTQYRPTPVQYAWDPVAFWGKPKRKPDVYRRDYHVQRLAPFGANRPRIDHPCPRPVEQVEYVVDLATERGDLVLDPFAGSGTTLLACIRSGRRCVGVEKEPEYVATARRRLDAALGVGGLFESVAPAQPDLFAGG